MSFIVPFGQVITFCQSSKIKAKQTYILRFLICYGYCSLFYSNCAFEWRRVCVKLMNQFMIMIISMKWMKIGTNSSQKWSSICEQCLGMCFESIGSLVSSLPRSWHYWRNLCIPSSYMRKFNVHGNQWHDKCYMVCLIIIILP